MTDILKALDEVLERMNPQDDDSIRESLQYTYWFLAAHAPEIRAALELKARLDAVGGE